MSQPIKTIPGSGSSNAIGWQAWAPLGSVAIWTGNIIVTRVAATVIEPTSITLYRWLLAFLILLPFVGRSAWAKRHLIKDHWLKLAVLGTLGMGLYQGLAYEAARTTTAVHMGVILAMMPLASAILASAFANETLTARMVLGITTSFLGIIIVMTNGRPEAALTETSPGDLLMLIAIASNALYGTLVRRWAIPLDHWQQLFAQIGFTLPILTFAFLACPITPLQASNIPLVIYAGIPASVIAPFLWLVGTKRLGAGQTALFMNLLPVLAALAAWVLLGESLQPYQALGGVVVLVGVGLAIRARSR